MFRKLMKYDNRSLRKLLLPIYGVSAAASFVVGLMGWLLTLFDSESISMPFIIEIAAEMLSGFSSLLVGAALYGTVIILAYRYHRNFNTDEGYLTFTLPVKVDSLIWSKLLSGLVWMLAGIGVTVVNVIIIFLWSIPEILETSYLYEVYTLADYIAHVGKGFAMFFKSPDSWALLIVILLVGLTWIVWYLGIIFLSLSIGGVIAQKHKGAAGIGMYLVLNFVSSFVLFFVMIIGAVMSAGAWDSTWGLIIWLALCAIFVAALSYLLVVINRHLLKNKLNLS